MEQIVLTEKRTHNLRYSFEKEIQFYLQTNTDETFKAITIDICSFGLGLYVYRPLSEGQEIRIKSDNPDLNKRGIVRWCKELGDNVYRVGIKFIT